MAGILVAAALLALAGEAWFWLRASAAGRCALDGLPIAPAYARVTVLLADGSTLVLGSPTCARTYLERRRARAAGGGHAPSVVGAAFTDEVSGRPLPWDRAYYVADGPLTSLLDRNRIHVFADEVEARRHALQYGGRLIPCPLRGFLPGGEASR